MTLSFSDFQTMHYGISIPGRARKMQSDVIMLNTWDQDIQSQICYIYDYYHDQRSTETLKLNNLHPENDPQKTPLSIKFIRHTKQTYDKDQVTFWLQMQPGQQCNLDYYEDVLGKRYDTIFPIGLYVDIMHEDGTYNKWLVVDKANYNTNQFPTFEILRCDFLAQWIYKGHKYQCPSVLRSQNSYNSGLWTDYKITTVEDQQKFAVPMTRETETLFYNIRMIVDSKVESEPRCWKISKINRISPNGICRVTLSQDLFDQHKDYVEKDDNNNIIGMWANYWASNVEPTPILPDIPEESEDSDDHSSPIITSLITVTGKPQIKIGGSAKTFTIIFKDDTGEILTDHDPGSWFFYFGEELLPNNLFDLILLNDGVKIKVKFLGDDSYIGKILTVKNVSGDVTASLDVEILPL